MTAATKSTAKTADAIAMLTDDHKRVKKMFKDFDKISDSDDMDAKAELVEKICAELTIHAQLEEEIFYPAARDATEDDDMLDEAEVEHATAKDLIAQLLSMSPAEALYNAKVTVLGEYINHHVEEEETEMFPKAKKAKLDLQELAEEMTERKTELQAELLDEEGQLIERSAPEQKKKASAKTRATA